MKKIIAALLVLATVFGILSLPVSAASYKTGSYTVTSNSGLNVRKGSGTGYSVVGCASKGTSFSVTSISGSWGYTTSVKTSSGNKSGWLCLDYCRYNGSSSTSYTGYVNTSSSSLILRSGPSTGYSVLAYMAKGSSVTVLDNKAKTNGFYHVKYGSKTGYASASYITFTKPVQSSSYSINGNLLTVKGVAMSEYRIGSTFENVYYANVNGRRVYTGAKQCYGYACYIEHKLYGCCWHTANSHFPNLSGSENVTPNASTLKSLIQRAGVGAHLRTKSGHSMVLIGYTDSGFTVADANANGTNRVDVRTYTWSGYLNTSLGRSGFRFIEIYR